jgi:5-(carboxyamino)imidazole ribonucleotide mutase
VAGVLAAHTTLPVIGVPIGGGPLSGIDALLSTAQMPPGVPVATMSVDGARNAGIFAAQILALKYPEVKKRADEYKAKLAKDVESKADKLASMGYKVWQPR